MMSSSADLLRFAEAFQFSDEMVSMDNRVFYIHIHALITRASRALAAVCCLPHKPLGEQLEIEAESEGDFHDNCKILEERFGQPYLNILLNTGEIVWRRRK